MLTPAAPQTDYCVLQSTPTHAFLFPRPFAQDTGAARLRSSVKPELADVIARSTSKGSFPPPQNAIQLASTYQFDVGTGGTLALSAPVSTLSFLPLFCALALGGAEGSREAAEIRRRRSRLPLDLD